MQQIAFSNLTSWFSEEFSDLGGDFGALLFAGGAALLSGMALNIISKAGLGSGSTEGMLAALLAGALATAFTDCMIFSVAKARLHERNPTLRDLLPDPIVVLNALCASILITLVLAGSVLLVALPALKAASASIAMGDQAGIQRALGGIGFVVLFVTAIVVFAAPLFMFALPLIVDRKMDFLRALYVSADCVRRDYIGLFVFKVLWVLLYGASQIPALCCFCVPLVGSIVNAVAMPFLYTIQMRAYRDYFGLSTDWVLEETLERDGFHEMRQQIEEEAEARRIRMLGTDGQPFQPYQPVLPPPVTPAPPPAPLDPRFSGLAGAPEDSSPTAAPAVPTAPAAPPPPPPPSRLIPKPTFALPPPPNPKEVAMPPAAPPPPPPPPPPSRVAVPKQPPPPPAPPVE